MEEAKELPSTITLKRAYQVSLLALANEEMALNKEREKRLNEIKQIEKGIEETKQARAEILKDVAAESGVAIESLNQYQFDGKELIKA